MRTLHTGRLELRTARAAEFDSMYEILVEEIEGPDFDRTAFDAEMTFDQSMAQQSIGDWFGRPSIILRGDGRYVGYATLMPRLCGQSDLGAEATSDSEPVRQRRVEVEIGWAISDRFRRRGLATEAARALLGYAWSVLRVDRVVAFTEPDNAASLGVMRQLDMHLRYSDTEVVGVARYHPPAPAPRH